MASVGAAVITLTVVYLIVSSVRPEAKTSVAKGGGGAIAVDDAIAVDRGERVAVRGFVFIDANVGELLCAERTRASPPACAGSALALRNLDANRLDLMFAQVPDGSYDAWSRDQVTLFGIANRTTFTVEDVLAS